MSKTAELPNTKKRGRPKKLSNERLEHRVDLRVSENEKAAFKLAAEAANQDLSVWIRIQLHNAAGQQRGDKDLDRS